MKRLALLVAVPLFAIATTAALHAQIPPPPTPTPDPHTYSDPAMNYTAPSDAFLVARRDFDLSALGDDLQTIAVWALHPGREDVRTIQISMESFTGPPNQWEGQFESQTHGSQDGTLIRDKTPMALLNGMPADFVKVTYGSGFDSRTEYAIVWADGQRGVVLSETARVGDASPEEAKRVLKNVTAVRYPTNQP